MILHNEILLSDNEEIIYKTCNQEEELYGMHSSKRGTIVEPSFLHIWEFEGETTVCIDSQESYWQLDFNGILDPLPSEKVEEYKSYIIKNSRCNCWNQENLKDVCQLCQGMQEIENSYSDRSLNKFFGWEE